MSLFYAHYGCHEGAIVMRKSDGVVYRMRGNISMWDMTAILVPYDPDEDDHDYIEYVNREGVVTANSTQFTEQFLILDEGEDKLTEAFRLALSQIASNKPPPK